MLATKPGLTYAPPRLGGRNAALVALGLLILSAPPAAQARSDGEDLFELSCSSCHTAGKGEPSKFGPNLFGVVGRASGGAADYQYSSALSGGKVLWTETMLDKFIESPAGAAPGTSMPFGGLADAAQRAEIIRFLKGTVGSASCAQGDEGAACR